MTRPLRIAQVAPPMERVPPRAYGGTERIVYELVKELDRRGHEVTTFASGDSEVPGRHIATVDRGASPGRLQRRRLAVVLPDDPGGPRPGRRVRHHPQPSRVGQLPARPGLADPGRLDVPRPSRPAVGGGELRAPDEGARRDQRQPGRDPPRGRMGWRRPQRPDPRRLAVRPPARRRAVLRRPGGPGEGDRRGDRDRHRDRAPAPDRGEGGPDGGRSGTTSITSSCRRSRRPVRRSSSSASSSRRSATSSSPSRMRR